MKKRKGLAAVVTALALSVIMCMPAMAATTVGTPTVSSLQMSGTSAVKVTASKPSGAAKWDYYCYNTSGKQIKSATNIKSRTTTISGLTPGTTYSFAVRCKNSKGQGTSKLSAKKSITLPIKAPTVSTTVTSYNSVRISSSKVVGAKSYVFYCYDSSGKQIKTGTSSTQWYTFSGLSMGTTYKFRIAARGANRTSGLSPVQTYTTTIPSFGIKSITTTTNSATVTAGANSTLGLKKWIFYCYDRTGKQVATKSGTASKVTFTGLKPGNKYTFKVQVAAANRTAPLTTGRTAITGIAAPALSSVTANKNTVKAVSNFPSGTVSLSFYCYDANGKVVASKVGSKQTTHTFTNLKYNSKYTVKVIAQGLDAKSAYSSAKSVTTGKDPSTQTPTQPTNPTQPTTPTQPTNPDPGTGQGSSETSSNFSVYEVGSNAILVKAANGKGGYVVCSKTETTNPASLLKADGVVADNGTGSAKGDGILVSCLEQNTKYFVYVSADKTTWEKLGTITTKTGSADTAIAEMYQWAKEFKLNNAYYISGATADDISSWWNENFINGDAKYALYSSYKAGAQKASGVNAGSKTLFVLNGTTWSNLCAESQSNEALAKQANKSAGITSSDTDAVKVTKMMNWLADNTNYTGSSEAGAKECFTSHNCVCNGYADALNAMCKAEGIPCRLVFGTCDNGSGAVSHVFNEVKIGESWYFIDPTWYDSNVKEIYITNYGVEGKMIGKIWVSHTMNSKLGE